MRPAAPVVVLVLVLTACASGPARPRVPWVPSPSFWQPAADPYAVTIAEEFPPAEQRYAPRVVRWTWERHRQELAAVAPKVEVTVGATQTVLVGPEPAVAAATRYLEDR